MCLRIKNVHRPAKVVPSRPPEGRARRWYDYLFGVVYHLCRVIGNIPDATFSRLAVQRQLKPVATIKPDAQGKFTRKAK